MTMCSVSVKKYGSENAVSGIRAGGLLWRKGSGAKGIGSLAGKEVHSRRVMKEGARANRGKGAMESPQSNVYWLGGPEEFRAAD